MRVFLDGKKLEISVKDCGYWGKVFGLMFRTEKTQNLLFDFKKNVRTPLHSWFVFFGFIVLWLDYKNRVIESRIVCPFESYVVSKKSFKKIIEIPANEKNAKLFSQIIKKGWNTFS
jgi:uncharacterized membrane protein (UPF0127 family)